MRKLLVAFVFAIVLLLPLASLPTYAQTATSTPFVVPATPTLVPPGNPGANGAWSVCTLYDGAEAYYCKFMNNGVFSVSSTAFCSGSGCEDRHDDRHLIIVPPDVVSVDLFCVYGFSSGKNHNSVAVGGGTSSLGGALINRSGTWSTSQTDGWTIYHAHRGTSAGAISNWSAYVQSYPIDPVDTSNGFGLRTYATAYGWTGAGTEAEPKSGYAQAVIQCQVQYYSTGGLPNPWTNEHTPTPYPTATLLPTQTPSDTAWDFEDWNSTPWAPAGWQVTPWAGGAWGTPVPWSTPVVWVTPAPWVRLEPTVVFEISDGQSACSTIIPDYSANYTIPLYGEVGFDLPQVQVCGQEKNVDMQFLGVNWGHWLVSFMGIGAAGLLYTRFRA